MLGFECKYCFAMRPFVLYVAYRMAAVSNIALQRRSYGRNSHVSKRTIMQIIQIYIHPELQNVHGTKTKAQHQHRHVSFNSFNTLNTLQSPHSSCTFPLKSPNHSLTLISQLLLGHFSIVMNPLFYSHPFLRTRQISNLRFLNCIPKDIRHIANAILATG